MQVCFIVSSECVLSCVILDPWISPLDRSFVSRHVSKTNSRFKLNSFGTLAVLFPKDAFHMWNSYPNISNYQKCYVHNLNFRLIWTISFCFIITLYVSSLLFIPWQSIFLKYYFLKDLIFYESLQKRVQKIANISSWR